MPIQDSVEMGLTLPELVAKVEVESYYPPLFEQAFGSPQVSSDRISRALAQFVRSMVSYQAKYDQGVATNFSNFTPQENLGRQIFNGRGRCDTCHTTDLFIAPTARNNGLDLVLTDNGLGNVTGNPADNGKFKVPSLRNIALTGPYMHDGRFATLAEVVAFYNNGVQASPNLDQRLRQNNGQPRRLNLNQNEQAALVAFLNTLTDPTFVAEAKFSDPFLVLSNRVYLPLVTK
jgi:cytochrome c peroxidase